MKSFAIFLLAILACQAAVVPRQAGPQLGSLLTAQNNLATLHRLLEFSGLLKDLEMLDGTTIFAPSDDAFAKVDNTTVQFLLTEQGKPMLADILRYHVLSELVYSGVFSTLTGDITYITLSRQPLQFNSDSYNLTTPTLLINGNTSIVKADINTFTGVVHVVDSVLLPPDLPEAVQRYGLSALLLSLEATSLTSTLGNATNVTLVAPLDRGFAQLVEGLLVGGVCKLNMCGCKSLNLPTFHFPFTFFVP
eukprot:Colp12_sorted_trinity150504_noHs@23240